MANITTDFGSIQTRNIDPHSPVTSENHNKLLKTFGTHKMYVKGFNIDLYISREDYTKKILAEVSSGIAYVQYMVIEMTSSATLEVAELPTNAKDLLVVLEYTYRAVKPVPIAYLKVIREENFSESNQLALYRIRTNEWLSDLSDVALANWLSDSLHFEDLRNSINNTPYWANNTYLRIDGRNIAQGLRLKTPEPDWSAAEGDFAVSKDYVDNALLGHSDKHNDYFVQKFYNPEDSELHGKIKENLDVHIPNPYLELCDTSNNNNTGIKILAQSDTVRVDLTKSKMEIWSPNMSNAISTITSEGVTGAIWSDIAEYFETDLTEMPEQGSCICIRNGKAVLSDRIADPMVIGCVSYKPSYILGGTPDFEKEFKENHKIPVAILGQIKDVKVYAPDAIYGGAILVSGNDGYFQAVRPGMRNGDCAIGKVLVPVEKGYGKYYCLIK